jgi:hypothetical protein
MKGVRASLIPIVDSRINGAVKKKNRAAHLVAKSNVVLSSCPAPPEDSTWA